MSEYDPQNQYPEQTGLYRAGSNYSLPCNNGTPTPQFNSLYGAHDFSSWPSAAAVAAYASPVSNIRSYYPSAANFISQTASGRFSPSLLTHQSVTNTNGNHFYSFPDVTSNPMSGIHNGQNFSPISFNNYTGSSNFRGSGLVSDPSRSLKLGFSESQEKNKKPHIKKPLNAFMLFMKEMRAKVVAECTLKESAAINQILGRKWHALTREDQAKYYEMARKEKELHHQLYPGWSARDNYAANLKRKKKRAAAANNSGGGCSNNLGATLGGAGSGGNVCSGAISSSSSGTSGGGGGGQTNNKLLAGMQDSQNYSMMKKEKSYMMPSAQWFKQAWTGKSSPTFNMSPSSYFEGIQTPRSILSGGIGNDTLGSSTPQLGGGHGNGANLATATALSMGAGQSGMMAGMGGAMGMGMVPPMPGMMDPLGGAHSPHNHNGAPPSLHQSGTGHHNHSHHHLDPYGLQYSLQHSLRQHHQQLYGFMPTAAAAVAASIASASSNHQHQHQQHQQHHQQHQQQIDDDCKLDMSAGQLASQPNSNSPTPLSSAAPNNNNQPSSISQSSSAAIQLATHTIMDLS